jgi:hypothetical protein
MRKQTTEDKSKRFNVRPKADIPYAVMLLDKEYRVGSYGHAASTLFGYEETSMMGILVYGILPGLEDKIDQSSESRISTPHLVNFRMKANHLSGKTFLVAVALRGIPVGTCRHLLMVRNLDRRKA